MKSRLLLIAIFLAISCVQSQSVKVMTYNIRVDFGGDGENNWEFRRDFLADQINYNAPDFLGTQEGKLHQLEFLDSALLGYARIGRGRDNSETQGEYSAIYYDKRHFKLISQDTFWLSDTPEVAESKGWDAALPRICTFGLFENLKTRKRVLVFNTHFDHVGETARENSAKLILRKIAEINTKALPVILTGDFNSEMATGAYKTMVSTLDDARTISKSKPFGPSGTFSGFKFNEPVTLLIDYIFVSKGTKVEQFAILSDSKNCKYPSDHLPAVATVTF